MRKLTKNEAIAVSVGIILVLFLFGSQFINFSSDVDDIISPEQNLNQITYMTSTDSNQQAKAGDVVSVLYTGKFSDGTVFDTTTTRNNEPIQFILGASQVIAGWDQGIVGMKVGEKKSLVIPPELGYGSGDYGPIPGNSTLYFDVELVGIASPQQ